ncbi:hypothetical protein [Vibrio agarivorans]|uniref:Porin family protein n=1 Tax=Vibrio agarivorans TaxID=153622 RepID=A0ABT7Y1A1_9VIBR|nr:hypothetical protein [Vibrio agarivorans]MDN2481811.1 hypothetical protein [Vibrio agarivorans]
MKGQVAVGVLLSTLSFSSMANFYVGANVGVVEQKITESGYSEKDNGAMYGLDFTWLNAVNNDWLFGLNGTAEYFDNDYKYDISTKTTVYTVSPIVARKFSGLGDRGRDYSLVYAKVGLAFWDTELKDNEYNEKFSVDDNDVAFGLGYRYVNDKKFVGIEVKGFNARYGALETKADHKSVNLAFGIAF